LDRRQCRAGVLAMDSSRHDVFARARAPADEHRGAGRRPSLNDPIDALHGGGASYDSVEAMAVTTFLFERLRRFTAGEGRRGGLTTGQRPRAGFFFGGTFVLTQRL